MTTLSTRAVYSNQLWTESCDWGLLFRVHRPRTLAPPTSACWLKVRLNGANPELVEEIRQTALRYGLLSEYTSYLVQEPGMANVALDAIAVTGAGSVREVIQHTGAGAGCTACHCRIRELLGCRTAVSTSLAAAASA